ncbi:MAG: retropepsin-like aspartic protease [Saprospiraceae bacterium]
MKSPVTLAAAMLLLCSMTNVYNPTTTHPILSGETFQYEVVKKLMLVQAEVDGKKGYFLFDTGASHLTLNQTHFTDKKLVKNVGATRTAVGGTEALHAMKVNNFSWGKVKCNNLLTPVADLSALEKTLGRAPLLGLIGYQIVKDYIVYFNYSQQTITLSRNNQFQKPPTYSLEFSICGHLPVLETTIGSKRKMYLGLDSGASVNVLDDSWQSHLADYAKNSHPVNYTGSAAGYNEATYVTIETMTLEDQISLQNVGLLLTDFQHNAGECFRLDGLVGIDVFIGKNVAIDYRNNQLHIWTEAPSPKPFILF